MLSEENEIALVVKRDDTTALKLRIMREQSGKYSRECAAKSCVEVV